MTRAFDIDHDTLPTGLAALEASAGTGKTYAVTHTVARMVAEEGVPIDRFLLVTYTRAAATELRNRTRRALVARRAAITGTDAVADEQRERLGRAIADYDGATITTIHGFCQLALGSLGVQAGRVGRDSFDEADDSLTREVVRDHVLRALAATPDALDRTTVGLASEDDPERIEAAVLEVVRRHIGNQGSALAAPPMPADPAAHPAEALAAAWGALVERIVTEITDRRRRAAVATFDSLISDLAACFADDGPDAERAAAALRSRFSVVLVDEFQDTDRLQWRIFDRGFASPRFADPRTVVIVGDPKQAIYRFRGADIATYVGAVHGSDREPRTLDTNYRSDAHLIDGLNALFRGARFDAAGRLPYAAVSARPGAPDRSVRIGDQDPAPVEIRWTDPADVADATEVILEDLGATIVDHLHGTIRTVAPDGSPTGERAITPGDLAVLVRSNYDGDLIARALGDRGIPAVRSGVGTVERSPAAMQWRALLHAMARPSDTRRTRLAATGWFFGLKPAQLDDETVATAQAAIATWSRIVATEGLHALWQRIRREDAALRAIAEQGDGDRGHTDLEHLVEVLHRGLDGRAAPAERVLAMLDDLVDESRDAEERRRRIESDAAAVQIVTIHSAKGLEYPIVFIPFGVKQPNQQNQQPYVFGHDDQRWVDVGPHIEWNDTAGTDPVRGDLATRKALAGLEAAEEDRRLAYVALTRPEHRLVMWVRHGRGAEQGGFGRVLWGPRDPEGALTPLADEDGGQDAPAKPAKPADAAEARAAYDRLVALAPHAIAHEFVDGSTAARLDAASTTHPDPEPVRTLPTDRELRRPGWRAWSYSGLTSEGTAISNYGPEHLRDDEPDEPASDDLVAPATENPWATLSAGTGFGDAVHRILEDADFDALLPDRPDASASLRAVVERHGFRLAPSDDRGVLTERLLDTVRTPLGAAFADRCPAEVLQRGSLRELEFSFDLGTAGDPAALAGIAELAEHLDADDPFREYFARIGPGMLATDEARGYLSGSIDLVARDPGTGATDRYWVVDYKTNREPRGHYDRAAVLGLMEHGNYPLQAALYLVALQRFLRGRLGAAYDAATHLGGASYWFVRGMTGADTPGTDGSRDGVCTWRPTSAFIDAFDALLGGAA
jgi:exodeoxyribonuclease V beta subunit